MSDQKYDGIYGKSQTFTAEEARRTQHLHDPRVMLTEREFKKYEAVVEAAKLVLAGTRTGLENRSVVALYEAMKPFLEPGTTSPKVEDPR